MPGTSSSGTVGSRERSARTRRWFPAGPSAHHAAADRHYYGTEFEATLAAQRLRLLCPARQGEHERPGAHLFKPLRQTIESINQTFKSQLHLERHGGHTPAGVMVRILQRILALTAAIWHNDHTAAPVHRSLTAYDHRPSPRSSSGCCEA